MRDMSIRLNADVKDGFRERVSYWIMVASRFCQTMFCFCLTVLCSILFPWLLVGRLSGHVFQIGEV